MKTIDGLKFFDDGHDAASNKPRLMFVAPRDFPLPADLVEEDEKRRRQTEFRKRVLETHHVGMKFRSPDELAWHLLADLANLFGLSRTPEVMVGQQEYEIVVEREKTTETHQIELGPGRIFELTPVEDERHVKKVTATPLGGGTPYVYDFRGGDLPPLASLTRDTGGSYRLQDGSFSFAEIGEPRFEEIEPGVRALLIEWASTNLVPNSFSPKTQTLYLQESDHPYVLSVAGEGSATIRVGGQGSATFAKTSGDTATEDTPVSFSITTTGYVDIGVQEPLVCFQLEHGTHPTSFIRSADHQATTRDMDLVHLMLPVVLQNL